MSNAKTGSGAAPLRVVLLSSGLGHVSRGVEIWMLEMLRHWPAGPERVALWSGGWVEELARDPRYRCLHTLSREHPWIARQPWSRRYVWEQQACLLKTLWRLRREPADVVYCGDPVLAWHLKRWQRWHGARVVFMNGMRLSPAWGNHLDGVHLLADPYLRQAEDELGPETRAHFFAVPHFADTAMFRPAAGGEMAEARRAFGLAAEPFLVLTVGPLGNVSGKRLEFLAREVAAVPSLRLVHAGVEEDGAAQVRREVGQALGDRIHWLGRVDRSRMADLYRAANVYSLGSLAEPFSIAILEALASGLPVVHHNDAVMCWQSGPGGRPVNMEAPGQAAASFAALVEDPGYAAQRLAARRWAEDRYAPAGIAARIVAQLATVAQRPAQPPVQGSGQRPAQAPRPS
jgi:1,2-diacylglycerol 3-alpha-glucosyltransferase